MKNQFLVGYRPNSRPLQDSWYKYTTKNPIPGPIQVQKEKKETIYFIRKHSCHNHAVSPGREARPVVVAVLGWSLFQDR